MYKIQKVIKTTVLVAGLFGLVGCGGECCESDVSISKGAPNEKQNVGESGSNVPTTQPSPPAQPSQTVEPSPIVPPSKKPPVVVVNDGIGLIKLNPCNPTVTLTSEGTYDPDGNDENLTYKWTSVHGSPMSTESTFEHKFCGVGAYEATLTVTDEQNLTASDRLCVLVGIDESEIPLIADAGADFEVNGEQNVTISGHAVCRDESIDYKWIENGEIISHSPTFSKIFSEGSHKLKLIIEDIAGNKTCDSVVVTVK